MNRIEEKIKSGDLEASRIAREMRRAARPNEILHADYQRAPPGKRKSIRKNWDRVMSFMSDNPRVLMSMIPCDKRGGHTQAASFGIRRASKGYTRATYGANAMFSPLRTNEKDGSGNSQGRKKGVTPPPKRKKEPAFSPFKVSRKEVKGHHAFGNTQDSSAW